MCVDRKDKRGEHLKQKPESKEQPGGRLGPEGTMSGYCWGWDEYRGP